jgi:hypothetical protein
VEFAAFCMRNHTPCPLIEITSPGDPEPAYAAPGADLRTDLPGYRIYRKGVLAASIGRWMPSARTPSPSPRLSQASLLLSPLCRTTSFPRYRCAHGTAFGAAPWHLPVPVGQDSALWSLSVRDEPP